MNDKNTSDNQENINASSGEKKFNLTPYKGDIYLIATLIILIILFPFGVLFYIWGRMNLMIHFLVLATFPLWIFMLFCIFTGILRFLRKNPWKKKVLIFIEICLPILFFIPFDLYNPGESFLCGYRDRIRSRLDVKAVREWMKTYSENYRDRNNNEFIDEYIPPDKLPDCLKPIRFGGVFTFRKYPDKDPTINQSCGGGLSHWGLTIGMEDMPFPDSEFYKEHGLFWLPVAPGIYVDAD